MSTALVWKNDVYSNVCSARKLNAVRGQYLIMRFRDSTKYGVWHRTPCSTTGTTPTRFLGDADTLDIAKAIAQTHANQYGREKSAAA
jgi:hypothetical protein